MKPVHVDESPFMQLDVEFTMEDGKKRTDTLSMYREFRGGEAYVRFSMPPGAKKYKLTEKQAETIELQINSMREVPVQNPFLEAD